MGGSSKEACLFASNAVHVMLVQSLAFACSFVFSLLEIVAVWCVTCDAVSNCMTCIWASQLYAWRVCILGWQHVMHCDLYHVCWGLPYRALQYSAWFSCFHSDWWQDLDRCLASWGYALLLVSFWYSLSELLAGVTKHLQFWSFPLISPLDLMCCAHHLYAPVVFENQQHVATNLCSFEFWYALAWNWDYIGTVKLEPRHKEKENSHNTIAW